MTADRPVSGPAGQAAEPQAPAIRAQLLSEKGWTSAEWPGWCGHCGNFFGIGAAISSETPVPRAECCADSKEQHNA